MNLLLRKSLQMSENDRDDKPQTNKNGRRTSTFAIGHVSLAYLQSCLLVWVIVLAVRLFNFLTLGKTTAVLLNVTILVGEWENWERMWPHKLPKRFILGQCGYARSLEKTGKQTVKQECVLVILRMVLDQLTLKKTQKTQWQPATEENCLRERNIIKRHLQLIMNNYRNTWKPFVSVGITS